MPMFMDTHSNAFAQFSPLKANVDDMLAATSKIRSDLEYLVDDSEAFGVLTEDTYMENCPEILKQIQRISHLTTSSTMTLTHDDEAFDLNDPSASHSLTLALQKFLSAQSFILAALATHHQAIRSTGPYYDSLSRSVNAQRAAELRFRAAVEGRYADVKVRTAGGWGELEGVWGFVVERFPMPSEIMVVD